MKNIQKLIASKPVKHNKNTLLFLLSFSKSQYEKNIEKKNILCECRRSKSVRNTGFREYFTTIFTELKKN